jgi:uncharacterized protein
MLSRFSCIKFISLLACCSMLVHCTNVGRGGARPLKSPYTLSADAYVALANNHMGEEKQALLLLAAGRLVDEGEWQHAKGMLAKITPLTSLQTDKKNLLLAKIDIHQKRPRAALNRLGALQDPGQLPAYERAQYHESLAHAYKSLNKPLESIAERIKLDHMLPDKLARENNRRTLWLTLTTLPLAELNTLAIEAKKGSVLRGWMELALISRQNPGQPKTILANLETWNNQYRQHPARGLLPPSLEAMQDRLYTKPKRIALLLPLTGPLEGPAHAIQDGFMAAFRANHAETSTSLRFYDTHRISAARAYHRAIADGAEYIIGPLSKPNVATVASMSHPVPTLLLNNVPSRTQDHAYQFGLSPPHEARQVAVKARQAGLSRALIIAPEGNWGDEALHAFMQEWQNQRGQVLETFRFNPKARDTLNEDIRNLLQAVPDDERKRQLKAYAKDPTLERTPLRREDFDVIFLLAYPSNARQIMPLLRYYYAGKVPVYATSSVYNGTENTVANRDLEGIVFCDMPWVFSHPNTKTRDWSEQFNSYTRLYALGMDSYALGEQLNSLLLFPALGTDNQTGALYLSEDHRISRMLTFGQFKQGIATPQ